MEEEDDKVGASPQIQRTRKANIPDESTDSSSSKPSGASTDLTLPSAQSPGLDEDAALPDPPSAEEQNRYYIGLPSKPRLVARSSTARWAACPDPEYLNHIDSGFGYAFPKLLLNVGPHPLTEIWDQQENAVQEAVVEALAGLKWNTVDVLRIGYAYQYPKLEHFPVTLMVSVAHHSVSWQEAVAVAVRCRGILQQHGVLDVECEIRESAYVEAVQPKLQRSVEITEGTLRAAHCISDLVGQSIAMAMAPDVRQTSGPYMSIGTDRDVCMLVCRHGVCTDGEATVFSRNHRANVIQPGGKTFDRTLSQAKSAVRVYADIIAGKTPDDPMYQRHHPFLVANQAVVHRLEQQRAPADRQIGSVFYAHPRILDKRQEWLLDWALVQLNQESYATPLCELENWVWLGRGTSVEAIGNLRRDRKPTFDLDLNKMRLQGVIGLDEITSTTSGGTSPYTALTVMKIGAVSGFTWGTSNEVRSLRRVAAGNDWLVCKEWCVLGVPNDDDEAKAFCNKGDSGSVVFDAEGRIGGIITGGCNQEEHTEEWAKNDFSSMDVTYVTPMEVLMESLKDQFGRAVLL